MHNDSGSGCEPESGRRGGQRQQPRFPFSGIVLITLPDCHTIPTLGRDLSLRGVAVSSEEQLPIGEKVSVWIASGPAIGFLRCNAAVRYRRDLRHGLEFDELTRPETDLVDRICRG